MSENARPPWPPLDESGRIPAAVLEAEWLAYAHRLMAMLHTAMAESGATYETIAARIGWPVARVKRAMWDPQAYRSQKSMTDLACAMGRRALVGSRSIIADTEGT